MKEYNMPNSGELIEKLARKLERMKFLNDLKECETVEDLKKITEKYEALCKEDSDK